MITVFQTVFQPFFLEISTDSIGFDLKSSEWRSEGTAVALLGVALEMIGRGTYQAPTSLTSPTVNKVPCEVHSTKPCDIQSQNWKDVPSAMQLLILMLARGQGSLKDSGNLVYALILAAQVATVRCYQMLLAVAAPHTVVASHQDTVNNWVSTKSNWPLDSIESRHVIMIVHSPQSVHSHAKLQDGLSKQGLLSLTCLPRSGRFGLLWQRGKRAGPQVQHKSNFWWNVQWQLQLVDHLWTATFRVAWGDAFQTCLCLDPSFQRRFPNRLNFQYSAARDNGWWSTSLELYYYVLLLWWWYRMIYCG